MKIKNTIAPPLVLYWGEWGVHGLQILPVQPVPDGRLPPMLPPAPGRGTKRYLRIGPIMVRMVQKWDKIFEVVLALQKGPVYLRELSRKLGIPHSTLLRLLEAMREAKIVGAETEGKIRKFCLRDTLEARRWQMMAEEYKLLKFIEKNPGFRMMVEELSRLDYPIVLIFGSHAKFTAGRDSDVDVFVEAEGQEAARKIAPIHSKISLHTGRFNTESPLGREIARHHILIKGGEKFYEKLGK